MPLKPIASRESPRQILEADFEDLRGRLPISGGWGYTQDDACVIDKNDPVVDPDSFDGLIFEISAIHDRDLEELTAEFNESRGHGSPGWDEALLQRKLEERRVRFTREFWFDITSFFHG